jgi:hypothetical protein
VQARRRAGAERSPVHDNGVTFNLTVAIEMGTVSGVERRIVFQNNDRCFDSFEGRTTGRENPPSGEERLATAVVAGFDGFIGNVPGPTMNDQ